ncbi:MAG: hypothetical protein MI923_12305 [Phycisphaerales bacterium]|nr:hypothetical protein [Phycisphaerales bacterium]
MPRGDAPILTGATTGASWRGKNQITISTRIGRDNSSDDVVLLDVVRPIGYTRRCHWEFLAAADSD